LQDQEESQLKKLLDVKAYPIIELEYGDFFEHFDGWTFRDFREHPATCHNWLGLTTVMYCPDDGMIHCGLERFDNDILYLFDPAAKVFRSLDFHRYADRYDVKIHRSLAMNSDGYIYGATALLHDVDEAGLAKGGKLFRYRPSEYEIEILGIPIPHAYIQSIAIDESRQMLYGFTFAPERMFSYDISAGDFADLGAIGSSLFIGQAHRPCVDDAGAVWGSWGSYYSRGRLPTEGMRVNLLKFDPGKGELVYYQHGLGGPEVSSTEMIDDIVNARDGFLYIGGKHGFFYRLDPESASVELVNRPFRHQRRISALVVSAEGTIYGAAGDRDCVRIFSFEPASDTLNELGVVYDSARCQPAEKIHSLTITDDGVLYGGEIDNLHRTSWLWEIQLR
jgi:hypothetical protein